MSINKPLLTLVMLSSAGFAGRAFATTTPSSCSSDVDCAHGYTCQSSGPDAPPRAGCAPDQDCAVSDGSGTAGAGGSSSTSVPVSMCEPGPCTTDSDCGTDMVCHAETTSSCSGGTAPACPANTKCDAPADATPPTCTTTTTSTCAFRWQLPCNADADCGSGFVCQPSVYGSCSGGSGVSGGTRGSAGSSGSAGTGDAADGGTATPSNASSTTSSPPDMCTTTTSFPGWCQVAATTCTTDADCPSNWLCQTIVTPGTTGSGTSGIGGAAAGGGGASESGGGAPSATDVVAIPTTKICASPYSPPIRGKGMGVGVGGQTGGSGTDTGSSPEHTSGTGGTLGGTTAPAVGSAAGTGGTTAVGQDANTPRPIADGACSVSPVGAHSGSGIAALLALLGLGLVVRRRRGA